jgi:ABC-type Fe3+ transport system permease subunit
MSYESLMGFGADPATPVSPVNVENVNGGRSPLVAGAGLGALTALLLGVVVIGLAMPFALGAAGAAIAAPKGERKDAAKQGAIYGGIAGIGAGILASLVSMLASAASGTRASYVGGAGMVPLAVGLYLGYKRRR